MNDERITSLSYLLAGFGVGVAAAVLMAPRSGADTRNLIQQKAEAASNTVKTKANETNEYIKSRAAQAVDQTGQLVDRGREIFAKQKEQLVSAVEAGKQAYRESVQKTANASV
jgi:gas vesicle protein